MIQYFLIQNTNSANLRKSQNILFFALVISFKPFQTHCTILCSCLPIEMTWNWVFLSETGEKSRLCFGKMTWNRVFLSETGGKLRLCLGKQYEMEYFLVKPVKNWDYVWNWLSQNYVYLLIWNGYNSKNLDLWLFSFKFS